MNLNPCYIIQKSLYQKNPRGINFKIILIYLEIFILSLLSTLAIGGEIYKWVDDKGTVHFTEDPSTIPEKYRDKVKSRTTEEDAMTIEEKAREKRHYDKSLIEKQKKDQLDYERSKVEQQKGEKLKKIKEAIEAERLDIRVSYLGRGTGYHVFRVEARNEGNSIKNISWTDFTLITEDNQSLAPVIPSTRLEVSMPPISRRTDIQPGTRYSGHVFFEGYKRGKTLVYNPTGETFRAQ